MAGWVEGRIVGVDAACVVDGGGGIGKCGFACWRLCERLEQGTIELDSGRREWWHHRNLLTVGGASVCCANSSRLHSHSEPAGSIGVRGAVAFNRGVTDFMAVLDQIVDAERGSGVALREAAQVWSEEASEP